jgi:hypothetical protein
MTRKRKVDIIPQFRNLPNDMVITILSYDDRFYLSKGGQQIISRFSKTDHRYKLLSKIPKFNYIWNCYYYNGNAISYQIYVAFLSKNKKNRYSLSYYDDETSVRKVVFRNHRSLEETMFFI